MDIGRKAERGGLGISFFFNHSTNFWFAKLKAIILFKFHDLLKFKIHFSTFRVNFEDFPKIWTSAFFFINKIYICYIWDLRNWTESRVKPPRAPLSAILKMGFLSRYLIVFMRRTFSWKQNWVLYVVQTNFYTNSVA